MSLISFIAKGKRVRFSTPKKKRKKAPLSSFAAYVQKHGKKAAEKTDGDGPKAMRQMASDYQKGR